MTTIEKRREEHRAEHDSILENFLAKDEMTRLKILRSWRFWDEAAGRAKEVFEKIEAEGLEGVSDSDMAALFMAEYQRVGQRPSVRTRALVEVGKMRVQRFRDELSRVKDEARAYKAETAKMLKTLQKELRTLETDNSKLSNRFDEELEKVRMQERRRLEEVRGVLG